MVNFQEALKKAERWIAGIERELQQIKEDPLPSDERYELREFLEELGRS